MGKRFRPAVLFIAAAPFFLAWSIACGGADDRGGADGDRRRVLAPIDDAEVRVLESFPPQYVLHVRAGLPSGCAREDGYQVSSDQDTVRVRVYNTLPTGDVACTLIYGTYELNISLGSDFQSGREYRVEVNDRVLTFWAQ